MQGRGRAASSLRRATGAARSLLGLILSDEFTRGWARGSGDADLRGVGAVESVVVEHAVMVVTAGVLQADAGQRGR